MQRINKFGDPYIIYKDGSKYIMSWVEEGAEVKDVYYEISKQNAEKAMESVDDGYEVMHFAQYGVWPPTEEEKLNTRRDFIRKFPDVLINNPDSQKIFSEEELEKLMSKAKVSYDDSQKRMHEENRQKEYDNLSLIEQFKRHDEFFDEDGHIK